MTRPLESSSKLHRFLTPCLGHSRTNDLSENQPFPCMQRTKNKRLTANGAIEQGERPKPAASSCGHLAGFRQSSPSLTAGRMAVRRESTGLRARSGRRKE